MLEYFDGPVGMLPLRRAAPTSREHGQLVKLAKDAESATNAAAAATTPPARAAADDRLGHVLRRIDDIVYDLYGITTEERALVDAHLR